MENYFRITAQLDNGTSFILDSHGMFDKLWEFSVYVKSKGASIIEATSSEQFIDINTQKEIQRYSDKLFLIACDPDPAKWILSFAMLAGRLEFTSLVVLFLPFLWRRNI